MDRAGLAVAIKNSETNPPDWHGAVTRIQRLAVNRPQPQPVHLDVSLPLAAAQVPRRLQNVLDQLDASNPYVRRVREWVAQPADAWCLILSGPKGVGKSTAAAWWIRDQVATHDRGSFESRLWWPATDIMRANWYSADFDVLHTSTELVIDDLGVEYADAGGSVQAKLDSLIDARYRDYRRTIITTNLNRAAFEIRYGERIYDRLRDGGAFFEAASESQRES